MIDRLVLLICNITKYNHDNADDDDKYENDDDDDVGVRGW